VPVVIVATEEGLAAIPRGAREASLALSATKLETTLRVVLPAVMPSILTGLILAMARAAGEVAPLMITGVVKLAPALPADGFWPFLHLDRKFMHLGFHIYDVGFQSPNVDAARPMVFTTTLLLLLIVVFLNLFAITMRNRSRKKYATWRSRGASMSVNVTIGSRFGSDARLTSVMEMPMVEIEQVNLWYGEKQALRGVNMSIPKHRITAYIGPSGCGKSTLLRCLNRMNDLVDGVRMTGTIRIGGADIHDPRLDVTDLRKRVGMVFQKSNPFPKSVFENVAYGPRILGVSKRADLEAMVERSLKSAALWDEVSDRLHESALGLSVDSSSALHRPRDRRRARRPPDGRAVLRARSHRDGEEIEELMLEPKASYTIVIVTHNMQQAAAGVRLHRVHALGELVELRVTKELFTMPKDPKTEAYITGRFG
jgi:phosphate transport system ATP-binding protein